LAEGLKRRGVEVTFDLEDLTYDAVLVINATRHLDKLWRAKRRGVRIVQRLGGINWLHRHWPGGPKGHLLAEARNLMMRLVRRFLTDHIVYQSAFVKNWWERQYGPAKAPASIIYNGVDLERFSPEGPRHLSAADVCLISVEGTQGADPFDIALNLAQGLTDRGLEVELLVFGTPLHNAGSRFARDFVRFLGPVPNGDLPYYYRGAHFYISTDIIAACPNSLIEALACGTPVLGYQAGVLPEMLNGNAGRCLPCQGDPWKGRDPGNLEGLIATALEIMAHEGNFRQEARRLAKESYGLDKMVDYYCQVFKNSKSGITVQSCEENLRM
jgi:glycosyltransferase involved in cell wall biosynthesis